MTLTDAEQKQLKEKLTQDISTLFRSVESKLSLKDKAELVGVALLHAFAWSMESRGDTYWRDIYSALLDSQSTLDKAIADIEASITGKSPKEVAQLLHKHGYKL